MQITLPILLLLIFGTGIGLVIVANFFFYAIIGEINGRSSPNDQIGMFGVNIRISEIFRRHKALFPKSTKRATMIALATVGIGACFIVVLFGIARSS